MTRTVVHGGAILDVNAGAYIDGHAIVIDGGRISAIAREGERPRGDGIVEIDAGGRRLLPGLIDAHCHLISRSAATVDDELVAMGVVEGTVHARRLLRSGITFVRDPGCRHRGIYALRDALEARTIPGPRAFAAGPNIAGGSAPREWRNVIGHGPRAIRRLVDEEASAGADWIKLIVSQALPESDWRRLVRHLDDEELAAAVAAARSHGLTVGSHCEGRAAAATLVELGIDCIDHGTVLDPELANAMAAAGTHYVPTVWAFSGASQVAWGELDAARLERYRAAVERPHRESVRCADRHGVPIAAGTDGAAPGGDELASELEALAACGLTPAATLRAATIDAAAIAGVSDERGSLQVGKVADVVAVGGDPLVRPGDIRDVALVIQDGDVAYDAREAA